MSQKILIFDSSSLINLAMNGLTSILGDLKKISKARFIITNDVKYETIDRPLQIKKFELGALNILSLLQNKILELPSSFGIENLEIKNKTSEIINFSNKSFLAGNEFMHIIDRGEASCLALSLITGKKNIESLIVVDERTTRMLGESPENLRRLFESKFHTKVILKADFSALRYIRFIRTAELVYIAYKNNLVKFGDGRLLDALLYAVKYKGCSISREEIEQIKQI